MTAQLSDDDTYRRMNKKDFNGSSSAENENRIWLRTVVVGGAICEFGLQYIEKYG